MELKRFQIGHCWYFLLALLMLSGAIVALIGGLNYETLHRICSITLLTLGVLLMLIPLTILLTKGILSWRRAFTFELPVSPVSWNRQVDDRRQLTNTIIIPKELEAEDERIPRGVITLMDE